MRRPSYEMHSTMIEINSIEQCRFQCEDRVVIALGFFDGIHLAHQRLIEECKTRAQRHGGKSIVFTFQNHPSEILTPDNPTPLLTPYALKRQVIQSLGIDGIVAVPFDERLCHTPATAFVEDVLVKRICAKELVVGFNFRFGFNRQGTTNLLKTYVPDSFERVTVIEQQFHDDIPISSSYLRKAIAEGNLKEANALLGRPFPIAGTVIPGDGRGKTIGIPTANIASNQQVLPPNGVYGVRVRLDELDSPALWGVMNIGTLPTLTDQSQKTVEIHILNHKEDIYGRFLIVETMEFIRAEKKFSGVEELIRQIHSDIETFRSHVKDSGE